MNEKIYFESKVKKSKTPIEQVIKKLDIIYPNSSLGFCHAIYAKLSETEANGNGVVLAKSVKEDVPKLRFTQANMNHKRELGPVLGTILDAWVNEETDEIEIVFSFFKSLYPKQWEIAEEALAKGNLTVSFELSVNKDDIVLMSNGNKKIKHCDFDGVGVLFPGTRPAYKNAKVLQVANDIINRVFNQSNNLVYASNQDAVQLLENVSKLIEETITENGGIKMDKKANDALLAKQKEDVIKEFGQDAVKDWTDDDFLSEEKIQALRASLKKDETPKVEKSEEVKSEEKKEEVSIVKEEAKTVVVTETTQKVTDVMDENKETIKVETEVTRKVDDQVKEERKEITEVTYTYAQVEEIKAEYEKKLSEKDKEIAFVKENAKKIVEIRAELGDFVKSLSDEELLDETKLKIAKLEKENHDLKNKVSVRAEEIVKKEEVAVEKKEEVVEKKDEKLETGHTEVESKETSEDRIKMIVKKRFNK